MPALQPIKFHFDLPNVDINIEPPSALPSVADALINNRPFPDDAFQQDAIPLGTVKASASKDFSLDKIKFGASGGLFAGVGVFRSGPKLFEALKAEGLDEPMVTKLEFPDIASSNLYAIRWGYNVAGSVSGSVALGSGLNFGASARRESLYAVVRSLKRTVKSRDALGTTINSWKMPRQVDEPSKMEAGTWLISETDGELKLTLGVEYGYDYSWVREAVKIGGLSGDLGLKIEMGAKAAFGFNTSGRYATVLCREDAKQKLRLQVFKLRQQGWSFAFDATVSAQASQTVLPKNFEEFIKGVFNLHGLQVITDIESVLDSKESLAAFFGAKFEDYAKEFLERVTGLDIEHEFDQAIGLVRTMIGHWQDLPHEVTSLLFGLIGKGLPLKSLTDFLKQVVALTDSDALEAKILSHLNGVDFFGTDIGKWLTAVAGEGILSLLANLDDEKAGLKAIAEKTLGLLDGGAIEGALKNLEKLIGDKLGLDKIFDIVNETDFDDIDAWLKKRLSEFLGKTVVFQDLEKLRAAINALRAKGNDFYTKGLTALTDKYTAEFHFAFQKSTSKTALLDVTFDFDPKTGDPDIAGKQLKNALAGNFNEILASQLRGVQLNKGVLTHEIKRSTHLEIKLPFFDSITDHINESLATGEVVDEADGRLWIFNLKSSDTVIKKSSISKLAISVELTRNAGVRQFNKESFRYDYSLLTGQLKTRRADLDEKLNVLVGEYFAAEFSDPGKVPFPTYLTALDKALDDKGIPGDNFFGTALTSFSVGLPGKVLAAWKNAPKEEDHPVYMAISRQVQGSLRRFIPISYLQNKDKYRLFGEIYPLLVYSSLPPMNKVRLTSDGLLKFTEDSLYWDTTDEDLRAAIFRHYCGPRLRDVILPRVQGLLTDMPDTRAGYDPANVGNMLALNQGPSATLNFKSLILQEGTIIRSIVKSGKRFREFLDAEEIGDAIEELARFGATITDAFNDKIHSIYKSSTLRPLGTLLLLQVAKLLDPTLTDQIRPSAMLDLYILKTDATFSPDDFFKGERPDNNQVAVHQPIVSVGDSRL